MSSATQFYGFFSLKAFCRLDNLKPNGSVYLLPDGGEVVVTAVYENPEAKEYRWEDAVYLGPVGKHLRDATFGDPLPVELTEDDKKKYGWLFGKPSDEDTKKLKEMAADFTKKCPNGFLPKKQVAG